LAAAPFASSDIAIASLRAPSGPGHVTTIERLEQPSTDLECAVLRIGAVDDTPRRGGLLGRLQHPLVERARRRVVAREPAVVLGHAPAGQLAGLELVESLALRRRVDVQVHLGEAHTVLLEHGPRA
jgi:hypothetical protein